MTQAKQAEAVEVLNDLRKFILKYLSFADESIVNVLAYWICATHIYETFDCFPYMVVTARTKRAGKTLLSDLIGFCSSMPKSVTGATAASLFRSIRDDKPTIIWDESEQLSKGTASILRAFLNVGFRKGQTIPRLEKGFVVEYETYCPKVFVLIGDVYDTLRDRSIIVEMRRMEPKTRYMYEPAKREGLAIADRIRPLLSNAEQEIADSYEKVNCDFLTARDEDIWRPIFTLCMALEPKMLPQLQRIAADLCAEKANPNRYIPEEDSEAKAVVNEYGTNLLRDVYNVTRSWKEKAIPSAELLRLVREIPTAPWRKFYSPEKQFAQDKDGLTMLQMAYMLEPFKLEPKPQRKGKDVFRGYSISAINEAYKAIAVPDTFGKLERSKVSA